MPIISRTGVDVTTQHLMPEPLLALFAEALPMGTVMDKKKFKAEYLPFYENLTVTIGDMNLSIRPAWTDYHFSPRTHIFITGHILFCHINGEQNWYYQPSTRLFSEDPKSRLKQFKTLVSRAVRRQGQSTALASRVN
jgi:hypothetical protein